ncbi:MAG: penicillin acylase family protein, partial [Rhodobacteraceae bacterium]|nr:penicillin acylase family protein [Paracoccaceae bacterium]
MRKFAVWLGLALLALVGVVTIALMAWEPTFAETSAPPPKARYTAEIIRDEWGVPHIHGKRDVDVAYGVAIAHSQDDFSTLQDVIAMTRGRYGAIAGEDGAAFDYALHLLGARETVERHYAALPADVRGLLDAYATGLNDYAADHPREVKLGNLFPVNGQDVATGFALRQPFFFGLGDTIGPLVKNTEADPEPGRPTGPTPLPTGEEAQNLGSNAFAIAPSRDPDGVTRLVSNSHQPWRGGVAWYEMVVESDEGWHFAGANFPGSPFPFLGHNETLGWTNTVNHPDMVDVYELTVTKEVSGADQRWMYQLDGKWLPLEHEVVTLPVRFGPLVLPIRRDVYRSQHGPVIHNDKGWFAIRYGGIDSIDQLDAYYRLNKAKDFAEWKAILAEQKIPSTNFVYADAAGNIAYFYNAAIPQRQAGP